MKIDSKLEAISDQIKEMSPGDLLFILTNIQQRVEVLGMDDSFDAEALGGLGKVQSDLYDVVDEFKNVIEENELFA